MCKRLLISILVMAQILILSGCNLPIKNNEPNASDTPEIINTSTAKTIEARLSPTVIVETPEPTATIVPTIIETIPSSDPTVSTTPTEAATPTEIPEVIYFDDFSDTSGWYTNEDDRYGFKYSPDGYHIYNNIELGLIWSIREQELSGVALEVDGTRIKGSEESYFGVVCNFKDDGDDYYALVIGDNGFYGFGIMEDGEFEFIASGLDRTDIIKRGEEVTNRIRGVCNGEHFLIYANGELLLDVWDNTLSEGIVGLVVGNHRFGSGVEIRFNDFAITWP